MPPHHESNWERQDLNPGIRLQSLRDIKLVHPVDARTTPIGLDSSQCLFAVLLLTDLLHHSFGIGRVFVPALRHQRFGPFPASRRGFTPTVRRKGQSQLLGSCFLPRAAHESRRLLAALFTLLAQDRSGLHRLPG
jgi:hypothetical protein